MGLLDDSFRVHGPDGRRIGTGDPGHADGRSDTARAALPGEPGGPGGPGEPVGLGRGTYTVAWRVVSADSHPVSGAVHLLRRRTLALPGVRTTKATVRVPEVGRMTVSRRVRVAS